MGGAVMSHVLPEENLQKNGITDELHFYGYQVTDYDYNDGAISIERGNTESLLPNDTLLRRVEDIFKQAIQEKDLPLSECRFPSVMNFKFSKLSKEEREEYNKALMEAITAQDKKAAKKASAKAVDYSQSFGGTAEDTKNEKEAAELLRNNNETEVANNSNNPNHGKNELYPILSLPIIQYSSEQTVLRKTGIWQKYLSVTGCFLYFHNLTKEIVAIRPDDYIEETDPSTSQSNNNDQQTVDPANGLPKVAISELPQEVDRIVRELKKTPLIIDNTANEVARTYFTYKAHLEDGSVLTVPFGKSGLKREEVMERCRKKLVGAMKTGQLFVLYLGGLTIDHADFKTKLCKKVISLLARDSS
jgi:hypothetical protein